ncbi:hypothetical protein [Legionella spiritensis]|uniref:Uncharacterized protein n=1 Tax=Legionella spiritensis TaxID=452 RepID=A0A0W0YW64_LEGSP|nr:hypothetical protein [Legionella spiritensis]KTD61157.1 hypothetical protein Lspi_2777 [Legionella spiritensis]SNV45270.1 Uncharacterised protein [Legionella spiritensis]
MTDTNKTSRSIFQPASRQIAYNYLRSTINEANMLLSQYLARPSMNAIINVETVLKNGIEKTRVNWPDKSDKANSLRGQAYYMLALCKMVQDLDDEFSIDHYNNAQIYFDRATQLGWHAQEMGEIRSFLRMVKEAYEKMAYFDEINEAKEIQYEDKKKEMPLREEYLRDMTVRQSCKIMLDKHEKIQHEMPGLIDEFLNANHTGQATNHRP